MHFFVRRNSPGNQMKMSTRHKLTTGIMIGLRTVYLPPPSPSLHFPHSLLPLLSVSLMSSWLSLSSSAQVEHLFIMIIGLFAVSALSALWKSFFGQYLFIRAQIKTAYKFIKRQRRQKPSHCLGPSSLLPLPAAAATNGVDLFYVIL